MLKPSKTVETITEIFATLTVIVGVALGAYNFYPEFIWVNLVGNSLWAVLGVWWNRVSLIIIQVVLVVIYVSGLYKYYFLT